MHHMDQDERRIAKALIADLQDGDDDISVDELSAKLTLHRTGFSAADENTLRAPLVTGRNGALLLNTYDIEIVVRRKS